MKMLARAALALSTAMLAVPATAATTVTIYGVGGSVANVTLPDPMAAALIASGRAVVDSPRDNDPMNTIVASFNASTATFLRCLSTGSSCNAGGGPTPTPGVGTLDFSDPSQSAFIL